VGAFQHIHRGIVCRLFHRTGKKRKGVLERGFEGIDQRLHLLILLQVHHGVDLILDLSLSPWGNEGDLVNGPGRRLVRETMSDHIGGPDGGMMNLEIAQNLLRGDRPGEARLLQSDVAPVLFGHVGTNENVLVLLEGKPIEEFETNVEQYYTSLPSQVYHVSSSSATSLASFSRLSTI
jgi:hypothetical protein